MKINLHKSLLKKLSLLSILLSFSPFPVSKENINYLKITIKKRERERERRRRRRKPN